MSGSHEVVDGFGVVLSGDGDVGVFRVEVDEQLFEDGLVELALAAFGEPSVELVGAFEEVELGGEDVGALLEAFAGVLEPGLELLAGVGCVGGQVDEVFFLAVDAGQFCGELFVQTVMASSTR